MSEHTRSSFFSARPLGFTLAGAAAGVIAALVASARSDKPATGATHAQVTEVQRAETPSAPRTPAAAAAPDLSRLMERLDALERRTGDAPDPGQERGASSRQALEAEERAYLAQIRARLRAHEAEQADPGWASETSTALTGAMEAFAASRKHGSKLHAIDCRSTSCVATMEFPSYSAAMTHFTGYVTSPFGMQCHQTAELPEQPEDATAPYTFKVLFYGCPRG
jgi:hypothetical protein